MFALILCAVCFWEDSSFLLKKACLQYPNYVLEKVCSPGGSQYSRSQFRFDVTVFCALLLNSCENSGAFFLLPPPDPVGFDRFFSRPPELNFYWPPRRFSPDYTAPCRWLPPFFPLTMSLDSQTSMGNFSYAFKNRFLTTLMYPFFPFFIVPFSFSSESLIFSRGVKPPPPVSPQFPLKAPLLNAALMKPPRKGVQDKFHQMCPSNMVFFMCSRHVSP